MTPLVSQSEYGARGMTALIAKYGDVQVAEWRRRGGRPRNRTLAEIMAARAPQRITTRKARRRPVVGEAPMG